MCRYDLFTAGDGSTGYLRVMEGSSICHYRLLGGILIIGGTTVGAGMLALPVSTGLMGFVPSLILFILFWLLMTYTALLMLEVNLWMSKDSNLITMAHNTLGAMGKALSWAFYLFLLYALLTAYIAGSSVILADFIEVVAGVHSSAIAAGPLPLLMLFGAVVTMGTRQVDYFNRLLMGGLLLSFAIMAAALLPHVQLKLLEHSEWKFSLIATSVIATSFGFHIVIPSLNSYFNGDVSLLKKAIFIGSAIPLFIYILWEAMTLGIIPIEGPHGIDQGFADGANGVHLLAPIVCDSNLSWAAPSFSFFAIITSFLGVSMSLTDFLADGLAIKKSIRGRLLLYLLTFAPPVAISVTYPRAFLTALEYAGGFGVITLLAILPALMVWRGRYVKGFVGPYKAPGGKAALAFVIAASLIVVAIELFIVTGASK